MAMEGAPSGNALELVKIGGSARTRCPTDIGVTFCAETSMGDEKSLLRLLPVKGGG
jgi:hypothetical protein